MSIQVNEFRHIPGKNDAEYIKLLKEHLEAQKQLTFKAIAKIKELSRLAEPEIIYCKDCKYNSNSPEKGNAQCDIHYCMHDQMGFCHMAERRGE